MKRLLLLCVSFFIALQMNAQFSKTPIFADNDIINVDFDNNGYYYNHKIRKGHTIYGLSKVFNIPVDEIFMLNNITDSSSVSVGDVVQIPVDPSKLIQSSYEPTNGVFMPVTYTVKPKETVFRIARMYFNQGIEDFKIRNGLASNTLSIGQAVKVGWLPIYEEKGPSVYNDNTTYYTNTTTTTTSSSPTSYSKAPSYTTHSTRPATTTYSTGSTYTTTTTNPTYTTSAPTAKDVQYALNSSRPISQADSSHAMSKSYPAGFRPDLLGRAKYVEGMTIGSETTVAHWDKTIPDNGVAYALHNDAVPNSYISIYNPNLRRSVKAKVIGSIPFGSYTSDVQLVISPRAAKQLGGLDQRFRVEINYIKK